VNLPHRAESDALNKHITILFDIYAEENLISSRVLKELLGLNVPPRQKEGKAKVRALGVRFTVAGVVQILWSLHTAPQQIYKMNCYVVDDDETPFDAIAGKAYLEGHQDLEQYVRSPSEQDRSEASSDWRRLLSRPRRT
jgi:hypothetical protein